MVLFLYISLFFSLGLFLFQIFLEYLKTVRVMLFAGSLLAIVGFVLAIALLSLPKPPPEFPLKDVTVASTTQYRYTQAEYEALIAKYEYLVSLQPTDRDLLINLALLYKAQGNDEKAEELTIAAEQLDPNNPLFLE